MAYNTNVYVVGTYEKDVNALLLGRLSLQSSQEAHQAGAYPGFLSMKRLRVFLLLPVWGAGPSQGYPRH